MKTIIALLLPVICFAQVTSPHTYEERFGMDQASITSPRIGEPGENSWTYVQNDGSLAITNGYLIIPVQSTPAETDLYMKTTSSFTRTFAQAYLFRYIPTTVGTGSGTLPGTTIGFTNGNPSSANMIDAAIGFDSPNMMILTGEGGSARSFNLMTASVDTVYNVAILAGGYTGNDDIVNTPYYSGQTGSSYIDGITVFVKVNNDKWKLRYKHLRTESTPLNAAWMNYNGAGKLDNTIVTTKSYASIMEPANYVSGTASNGTQLFDITPEQGTAWDSLSGNFVVTSNTIAYATSTVNANIGPAVIKNFSSTDMYAEMVIDDDGANFPGFIFRWNPADSTAFSVSTGQAAGADSLRIYYVDFSTGVGTRLAAVSIGSKPAAAYILRASCIGNQISGWVYGTGTPNSLLVTSASNSASTYHGFRTDNTVSDLSHIRFYYGGSNGEYDILNQLMGISFSNRRGAQ